MAAPDIDALLTFAKEHPLFPRQDLENIRRYLTDLISSPGMIIDHRPNLLAVLIDNIENRDNSAFLEIIGLVPSFNTAADIDAAIAQAQQLLPEGKSGLDLALPPTLTLSSTELLADYQMYDLVAAVRGRPRSPQPGIEASAKTDLPEIYTVLSTAFKDSRDTSVPPRDSWLAWHEKRGTHFLVRRDADRIAGYINVMFDEDGAHVGTLGVLPADQRRGIGHTLLEHLLYELSERGVDQCRLSVAATNEKALSLYRQASFEIEDQRTIYTWRPSPETARLKRSLIATPRP